MFEHYRAQLRLYTTTHPLCDVFGAPYLQKASSVSLEVQRPTRETKYTTQAKEDVLIH